MTAAAGSKQRNPILRDWLVLFAALSLLAFVLGATPPGHPTGGQLPYVDAAFLELIAGPGDAAPASAREPLRPAGPVMAAAIGTALVLLTMLGLYRAAPGAATTVVVVLALAACLAMTTALARLAGLWLPPAGTLAALLLAGPLWNGRRLGAVTRALAADAESIREHPDLLPPSIRHHPAEAVASELQPLRDASARIRVLRRLLHTLVDRLPHPAIVTNGYGEVLLSNRAARTSFASKPIEMQSVIPWLRVEFGDRAEFSELPSASGPGIHGLEAIDRNGRHWLVDLEHAHESSLPLIYLLQFTDITALRLAETARGAGLGVLARAVRRHAEPVREALDAARGTGALPDWAETADAHLQAIVGLADDALEIRSSPATAEHTDGASQDK